MNVEDSSEARAGPYSWTYPSRPPEPADSQPDAVSTASTSEDERHYHTSTHVMPKASFDHAYASAECIHNAFSPIAIACGIRSLPNALHPGFRHQLYGQLIQTGQVYRQTSAQKRTPPAQHANEQDQAASSRVKTAGSLLRPNKYSTLHGFFSIHERAVSEFERQHWLNKLEKLHSKAAQVGTNDFVVKGAPPGHKGTPTFSPFSYDSDPFRPRPAGITDVPCHAPSTSMQPPASAPAGAARRSGSPDGRQLAGVPMFLPAGRCSSPELALKARAQEMLAALGRKLASDWPGSYRSVGFEAGTGAVIVAFDAGEAGDEQEASVRSYMGRLATTGEAVVEFRLCKDAEKWGQVEGPCTIYRFWPPWVHQHSAAATAVEQPPLLASGIASNTKASASTDLGRDIFAPSRKANPWEVRPFERTMRF